MGGFELREYHFVERFLKPGMVFLDVGAHNGYYTLLASKQVGDAGHVVAFEPSPRERRRLRWNLALNKCHNVQMESTALGDYEGETSFFVVLGKDTGCNSMRPPGQDIHDPVKVMTVPITTLDNYLSRCQISSVDFIKVDAEGGELGVLKGASEFLSTQPRPILMCELTEKRTAPFNYTTREIYEFLAKLRCEWFSVKQGGYLCPEPVKDKYSGNLIAVPQERLSEVRDWIKGQSRLEL